MLEKYLKWVLAAVAVGLIAYLVFAAFAQEVGATVVEKKVDICHKGETINISVSAANKHLEEHEEDYKGKCKEIPKDTYKWVETGTKWSEVCKAETPVCNTSEKGTEYGTLYEECQKVKSDDEQSEENYSRVRSECKKGETRTSEVSRSCEVKGDVCEGEGSCSDACGLESYEVADGKGGVKVCEATPACVDPTCEELDNCPVPPVVPPVKKDTPDRVKFSYTQGPDKGKGDGMCKLQWKQIEGSKKVEIRYAEDSVFGNGYKTIEVKDDGSHWVEVEKGLFKIRGRDSKTEWSSKKEISC